ncbi:LxmA leader domain family RiPP [Streptomyces sp. LZ34]
MSAIDLMGGYAAYTTPDAAVAELATTGTAPEAQSTITIITTTLSLITTVTAGD